MEGIEGLWELIPESVEYVIISILNAINDAVGSLTSVVPNPDPFPPLIENMVIDNGSFGARAFFYMNQFVDVGLIAGMILAWFPIFVGAWLIQMLWSWAKAKNKG